MIVGKDGAIDRIVVPERLEAHRLIEEFMIQANVAAAETLEARKSPLVYRIHDAPSLAKLEALREFLKSIDMTLPKGGNLRPSHFNRILDAGEGQPSTARSSTRWCCARQAQAEYNPENIGHFGLNLRRYAHFTSPIRRYADLIVHRALVRALGFGAGRPARRHRGASCRRSPRRSPPPSAAPWRPSATPSTGWSPTGWPTASARPSAGRISGVTRAGLFVKLDETGADGFVPMSIARRRLSSSTTRRATP